MAANSRDMSATKRAAAAAALGVTLAERPSGMPASQAPAHASREYERRQVRIDEYVQFREQGFLVVRGLIPPEDIEELRAHLDDLVHGRVEVPGLDPAPADAGLEEIERRYVRIHMLHWHLPLHERFLLHPRTLDILEALIGPDVIAMQSMLFLKPPGSQGQGWHQDSYYIPTFPDSLCGAWIAVDRADEENGCLWMAQGSQNEPVYPTPDRVGLHHRDSLERLEVIENPSNVDDVANTLSRVAARYADRTVSVIADPGDAVFFSGHVLHRSYANQSATRFRRSFVGHYANARSYTEWDYGLATGPANHRHILARGTTQLPFGQPRFGTPCAALMPEHERASGGPPLGVMADGDMMDSTPMPGAEDRHG